MNLRPAALCLVLVLAGCGGGSDTKAQTPSPTVSPTPSPTPDEATIKAAITASWERFFNPKGTVAEHTALLQNGEAFTAEITASAKDPSAADLSSKVKSIIVQPASAKVTYDLLGKGGVVLLTDAVGAAVLDGGTWKVSKLTYCQLIGLQDPQAVHPGCA